MKRLMKIHQFIELYKSTVLQQKTSKNRSAANDIDGLYKPTIS